MTGPTDQAAQRLAAYLDTRGPDRPDTISTAGQARYGVPRLTVTDLRDVLAELGQAQYEAQNLHAERDALRAVLLHIDTLAYRTTTCVSAPTLRGALVIAGDCHQYPSGTREAPCMRIHGHDGYHRNRNGVVWARRPQDDAHSAAQRPADATADAETSHTSTSPQPAVQGAEPSGILTARATLTEAELDALKKQFLATQGTPPQWFIIEDQYGIRHDHGDGTIDDLACSTREEAEQEVAAEPGNRKLIIRSRTRPIPPYGPWALAADRPPQGPGDVP